jgi:hypothetical protein
MTSEGIDGNTILLYYWGMVLPRNYSFSMHCNFSYRHFLYLKASRKSCKVCMRDQSVLVSRSFLSPNSKTCVLKICAKYPVIASITRGIPICERSTYYVHMWARDRWATALPGLEMSAMAQKFTIAYLIIKGTYRLTRVSQTSICGTNLSWYHMLGTGASYNNSIDCGGRFSNPRKL